MRVLRVGALKLLLRPRYCMAKLRSYNGDVAVFTCHGIFLLDQWLRQNVKHYANKSMHHRYLKGMAESQVSLQTSFVRRSWHRLVLRWSRAPSTSCQANLQICSIGSIFTHPSQNRTSNLFILFPFWSGVEPSLLLLRPLLAYCISPGWWCV
jgi:hypothetical protein